MDIIIVELVKAIQDGQMLIDDVPEIFKTAVGELIQAEAQPPESEASQ